jgi:hypothetical protein
VEYGDARGMEMDKKSKEQIFPNPNLLLKIIAFFIIIDFFAFQKELSGTLVCILVDIPLLLFAIVNFIWAKRKELPVWMGYGNLLDDEKRVFFAYTYCIIFVILAILIAVIFPFADKFK